MGDKECLGRQVCRKVQLVTLYDVASCNDSEEQGGHDIGWHVVIRARTND